jgi:hypothetical protein
MAMKEICAVGLILVAMVLAMPASASSLSDLKSQISSFDDPRIGSYDLAFYLASHGFDATPMGDFVIVDLGGHVYRLTPNGDAPGLCSMAA